MKNIEIDEELYQYIAANTQFIGESASSILRRLLAFETLSELPPIITEAPVTETPITTPVSLPEVAEDAKTKIPQNIDETVFNYINKEELAMQRGAVGRFLLILAALYRGHHQNFSFVTDISGRDRLYFARNQEALEASGSSTKPRQIPDSPFWVITNSNTTRKKMILTKVALGLGYSEDDAEKIRELL